MKKPIILSLLLIISLIISACQPQYITQNNKSLCKSIEAITASEINLTDIVPFQWDTVYTFTPYTSKDTIEKVIGFKSDDIQETINEGMVQLIFVKDKLIVSSICGYCNYVGYNIHFGVYEGNHIALNRSDTNIFTVSKIDGLINLTYKNNQK